MRAATTRSLTMMGKHSPLPVPADGPRSVAGTCQHVLID